MIGFNSRALTSTAATFVLVLGGMNTLAPKAPRSPSQEANRATPPSTVLSTTTTSTTTTTAPPRTRDERCWDAFEAANLAHAPGYFLVCGPNWNTGIDGATCPHTATAGCDGGEAPGEIRLHPDDTDSDAYWIETARHEIGHSLCIFHEADYSEACAIGFE